MKIPESIEIGRKYSCGMVIRLWAIETHISISLVKSRVQGMFMFSIVPLANVSGCQCLALVMVTLVVMTSWRHVVTSLTVYCNFGLLSFDSNMTPSMFRRLKPLNALVNKYGTGTNIIVYDSTARLGVPQQQGPKFGVWYSFQRCLTTLGGLYFFHHLYEH